MNKINIFWIEDNPVLDDYVMKERVPYPSFKIADGEEFFSFRLFQHPAEVHEYLAMAHHLNKMVLSKTSRERYCGALPDIVVFDYKLSDNFTASNPTALQYTHPGQYSFLQEHSASLELKRSFLAEFDERQLFLEREDVLEGNYDLDEFRKEIGVDALDLNDEFGLYSGIAIIREFKDFITLGVPATFNKADKKAVSQNALFYEWLNSYDIKDAIQRPDKGSKNWNEILSFALPLLRARIEAQIQNGRITPSYDQLIQLSTGELGHNSEFSLLCIYGERHLPLKGLFLDQGESIPEWANRVIEKLPVQRDEISKAIEVSRNLWEIFCEKFVDRIDLSDYTFREPKGLLDEGEQAKFASLKDKYCTNGKINTEYSIQKSFEGQKGKAPTVRLAVLHLITTAAIEMNKCSVIDPTSASYAELSKHEYFNVLFPFVNLRDSLLLPMHAPAEWDRLTESRRKWLETNLTFEKSNVTRANCLDCKEWITDGEKTLLKAIFYEEREFFPPWLTS